MCWGMWARSIEWMWQGLVCWNPECQSFSQPLKEWHQGTPWMIWLIPEQSQGRTKVLIMQFLISTMPKGTYAHRWKDKCLRLELEITQMPLSVISIGGHTFYSTASLAVKQVVLRVPITLTSSPETIRQVRKVDMQIDFHFPWTTERVTCCCFPPNRSIHVNSGTILNT